MEEIEDSIRRCEELLTISPLTFSTGENTGRSCGVRPDDSRNMNPVDCTRTSLDLLKMGFEEEYSHGIDWKRNMDLLLHRNQGMNLPEEKDQAGELEKGTATDMHDSNDALQIEGGSSQFVLPQKLYRMDGYKASHEMEISGKSALSSSSSTRNVYGRKSAMNTDSFFPFENFSRNEHRILSSGQEARYDTPRRAVSKEITHVIENRTVMDNFMDRQIPDQDSLYGTPRRAYPRGRIYVSQSTASIDKFSDRLSCGQEDYPGTQRRKSPRGMAYVPEITAFEDSGRLSLGQEGHHGTTAYVTENQVSKGNFPARLSPGESGHHGSLIRSLSKGTACISENTPSEDRLLQRSSPDLEAHLDTLRRSPLRGTSHVSENTASEGNFLDKLSLGQEGDYGTLRRELSKGAAFVSECTVSEDNLLDNLCEVHNGDLSGHVSNNSQRYTRDGYAKGKSSEEESHLGETIPSPHMAPCLSPNHSIAKWEEEMAGIKSGVLYPDYTRTRPSEFLQEDPRERIMPHNLRANCFQEIWLEEQLEGSISGGLESTGSEGYLEISGRMTAPDFGKTNTRCSNPMLDLDNNQYGRSKSVPKERQRENIPQNYQRSKSVAKERCKERLKSLSKPRNEVYKKLGQLKALLEANQLQECSFKPTICRKPNPEFAHSAPIINRIMEIQQRLEYRKRARKVYEKEELDQCSFWPTINWQSQLLENASYQPIEQRFQELQKQKIEKLTSAQLRKEAWLTFKPEINARSARLFKQKGLESIDVADRLTSMQHSFHKDCKHEAEKEKITFTPEINKNTDEIIASSKQFGGCLAGFLERQQYYLQAVEEKKKLKGNEAQSNLTFRPNIGNSSMILKQSSSRDVLCENDIDTFERLAYRDKERQAHARRRAAEQYYSQFNFKPRIDKVSKFLASSTSVQDLYKNTKGKKTKEALLQASKEEFQKKYPFHPKISSSHFGNNCHIRSIIFQKQRTCKERKILENEARTCKELMDIKECTFKPCLNPTFPKDVGPVLVKGMKRHLELQNIAKQMKKDQEEWEHKVFFSHAYSLPTKHYTIPKPFALQTAQGRCQRQVPHPAPLSTELKENFEWDSNFIGSAHEDPTIKQALG